MIRWVLLRAIDKVEREWNHHASHQRNIHASPWAAWMVSRVTHLVVAAAVVGGVGVVVPAASAVSDQPPTVSAHTLTPERIAASAATVVGLIGAVIGGLAVARSGGRTGGGNGRRGAIVALVMGPIGLVVGGMVVATADGGLGTGNGLGGGIVAIVVGLIGGALGWLALARSRRIA